jgi:hypothetical protein
LFVLSHFKALHLQLIISLFIYFHPLQTTLTSYAPIQLYHMGADEFKWTKIDVKMSTFLQFLLHLSMCCHFNGMRIMESCDYRIICILKNLNESNEIPISKFGLNKRFLTISFNDTTFIKRPLNLHDTIYFILILKIVIG